MKAELKITDFNGEIITVKGELKSAAVNVNTDYLDLEKLDYPLIGVAGLEVALDFKPKFKIKRVPMPLRLKPQKGKK